jgi:diguanylate cyclase (GGDEF)-like protein|tara:strand:- start:17676 stop:18656 length:981 start_codon:yes stop_codon:yes gene_type:complete
VLDYFLMKVVHLPSKNYSIITVRQQLKTVRVSMNDPITREDDDDQLLILHSVFNRAVVKHHAGRLKLFLHLQFPSLIQSDNIDELVQGLNILPALEGAAPDNVRKHPLFSHAQSRQASVLTLAIQALSAAMENNLDTTHFCCLADAMHDFDTSMERFDAGLTASLTDVDELTGLLNRSAMERDLLREIAQSKRKGTPLSLAMVDADHFKEVNDLYGHGFGDYVLEVLADRFEASLRPRDGVYRYGGEEFVVMLPETNLDQAVTALERLRIQVHRQPISKDGISITQTVSVGVSEVFEGENINEALKRADNALYQAKDAGRNITVSA